MIDKEREAEILRLYHAEKWRMGTIAAQLHVHHSTVRRVIAQNGGLRTLPKRQRKVDPFLALMSETLEKYPQLSAARLFEMMRQRGYSGKITQFRAVVSELRQQRSSEAFLRLRTLPGEQAQVDWAHFGQLECGAAHRPLMAFVIVLSYCRAIFLRFFLSQSLSNFLHGHQLAFEWFGGVSRVCLYDNLKSVVIERLGDAIRFNSQFTAFAGHYRFEPRPTAVARGNEKGRVERAIRYIRNNFFYARKFTGIEDLNRQALSWCETTSLERLSRDEPNRTIRELFTEEKSVLLPLPEAPFPCDERLEVSISKTPYARFDLNDYSVPPSMVGKTLTISATINTVRILNGLEVIATHQRCYDRRRQIENPSHLAELRSYKAQAGQHRATHVLTEHIPSCKELLGRMAERNLPLTSATRQLLSLLHTYGAAALESAVKEALGQNAPHLHAVQHILEREREQEGKPPILPLPLAEHPRLQNLIVQPHDLASYDNLMEKNYESDND
jgi:transposase